MAQPDPAGTTYGLTELPEGSKLRSVTAIPAEVAGPPGIACRADRCRDA